VSELAKAYDPTQVESRIYEYWLQERVFEAEVRPGREPFCIVIPPPNVTGALHMGHALDETVQDLLIRWERMRGKETLWLPGTDHAGIATQNKVEEMLAAEGLTRHDLGRGKFLERMWQAKEEHHGWIVEQLQRLGSSCDWRRERFTLDEGCTRAVREAFVTMYERGWIYKGARMINWCPRCTTGLSDLEVEHEERNGSLWHIRYPVEGSDAQLVVATTRPETMLGDTGVAVHPEDARYADLVGRTAILPLMDRPIPIVADEAVQADFAAGALKVTPGHDPTDLEIGQRHNLPSVVVIGDDGRMTEAAGKYAGLDRDECRKRVVEDLQALGLLVRIEPYTHAVGTCSRCDTTVEPLVSEQWFVRPGPLAEPGLEAVRAGLVRFVPDRWTKVYTDWMEGLRDWCISRQLWWGHRIPVWTCGACGEVIVAREDPTECPACGAGADQLAQDEDVLDTWFSSGLWPFSTLGWPDDTPELHYFFPTSVLVTGYDIIFFWVARMITMSMTLMGREPFGEVFIHGLLRDEQGRKMSKSLGNVVDPLGLIDEYGADSLRFALTSLITHGQDITYGTDRLVGARNFCNKLWNAARFTLMNLADRDATAALAEPDLADRWILSRHNAAVAAVNAELEKRNLSQAALVAYDHVWGEFCDWYVELAKVRLYGDDPAQKARAQATLATVFEGILKLLHPLMPFITEELWQVHTQGARGALAVQAYPQGQQEDSDADAERELRICQNVVAAVREVKRAMALSPAERPGVTLKTRDEDALNLLSASARTIASLSQSRVVVEPWSSEPTGSVARIAISTPDGVEVRLDSQGLDETRFERKKLALLETIEACERKLNNPGFLENAPPEVVEGVRGRLAQAQAELEPLLPRGTFRRYDADT